MDFKQVIIYPITDQKLFRTALEAGFDDADASLLSNGRIAADELYLISEDHPFITFSQIYNMPAMQLVDLFRILATLNYIDKTDFYNLIKFLRDHRNITQKKEKNLLNWLKTHE